MAQQININEIVPPMLNMVVQVMPLKMIMGAMSAAMGGGMVGKTEKKEQYWWVVEYNTVLYTTEHEPRQNNVVIYGPKDSAVDAMKSITKRSDSNLAFHTFSTTSSSRVDAFNTFLDWLRGKRINTTNVRQSAKSDKYPNIKNRIDNVFFKAEDAFWAEVAKAFPEVKTGDFAPDEDYAWSQMAKKAIASWLLNNHPKYNTSDEAHDVGVDELDEYMRSLSW